MSRHRSPAAGATGHRTGTGTSTPIDVRRLLTAAGAPLPPSRRCALRRGVTAAAVTGGALAVGGPAAALITQPPAPVEARVGLAAADAVVPPAPEPAFRSVDGALLAASVLPVHRGTEPPGVLAADNLLKSAALNDAARRAEQERLAREARINCGADLSGIGAVKPHVRQAAMFLSCLYDEPDLIGVSGRSRVSDHPTGYALDLMTRGAEGDRIAACALANRRALGISYLIWAQRYNDGSGWVRMEDRGSDTENHYDHVHISFARGAGGSPDQDLCR